MLGYLSLSLIFLLLALGIFGFTDKALLMWSLGVNLFYIGWIIIHYWRGGK